MELHISQLSLKKALGTSTLVLSFRCGEQREELKCNLNSQIKQIKVTQSYSFEIKESKFVLQIQSQLSISVSTTQDGYASILGNAKFSIAELLNKENSLKIALEQNNEIQIKCMLDDFGRKSQTSTKSAQQWTSSLRDNNKRYSSPQQSRQPIKVQRSPQRVPMPKQEMKQIREESAEVRLSPEEVPKPMDYTPIQQYRFNDVNSELQDYKLMAKQLALLLGTAVSCDSIILAVSDLLKNFRQQTESIIRYECDIKVLNTKFESLQNQTKLLEDKTKSLKEQSTKKINKYRMTLEKTLHMAFPTNEEKLHHAPSEQDMADLRKEIEQIVKEPDIIEHNGYTQQLDYGQQ